MILFESVILSLFDSFMMITVLHSILKPLNSKKRYIAGGILLTGFLVAFFSEHIDDRIISRIAVMVIGMLLLLPYLWVQGCKSMGANMLAFLISSLFLLITQLISILILNIILGQVKYTFLYGIVSQFLSTFFLLFIVKILPVSSINIYIERKDRLFDFIITVLFFVYYYINILWDRDIDNINGRMLSFIVVTIFTIIIHIVILRDGLQNKLYQEKLQTYDTYFPVIDDIVEEFKRYQHDFHNHIQTIIAMKSEEGSDDSIDIYLLKMNESNIWQDLIKIQNKILLAFIYSKYVEAQNKGVRYHLYIYNCYVESSYDTYELVELYGILLDNALEATCLYHKEMAIEIYLKKEKNRNIFEVRNPSRFLSVAEINRFFKNGFSTKSKQNHGIGLGKAKTIVEKKKGTISFYYDTSIHRVIVRLEHD